MKYLQQLAYDVHISAMSITNTFAGTANTSVVCCLHSSILFEISDNKEAFFPHPNSKWPNPQFEVLVKNLCSKGSYSQLPMDWNRLPPTCLILGDDISPCPVLSLPLNWLPTKSWFLTGSPLNNWSFLKILSNEIRRKPWDFSEFSHHYLILGNYLTPT